jgi:hypothetical protein
MCVLPVIQLQKHKQQDSYECTPHMRQDSLGAYHAKPTIKDKKGTGPER